MREHLRSIWYMHEYYIAYNRRLKIHQASRIGMTIYRASARCMTMYRASNICSNIYGVSNIFINTYGASNICMNIEEHLINAWIYYGLSSFTAFTIWETGSQHLPYARSSELDRPELCSIIEHLGWAWTPDWGLGNHFHIQNSHIMKATWWGKICK